MDEWRCQECDDTESQEFGSVYKYQCGHILCDWCAKGNCPICAKEEDD